MKRHERGAALLMAMLTVALVATFAAAALWQQWRGFEVEAAERGRVQAEWVLTGALDWARLVLKEDSNAGGVDHLGEPWAVPLEEARLSSFLAADRNATGETPADVFEAFLSGQMIDLQSFLNVGNLVDASGKLDPSAVESFARLFDLLGIPRSQLDAMAENLRFASDKNAANQSGAQASLVPQTVDQLAWLGVSPETIALLRPYVTVLPGRVLVNFNTASPEVIYAVGHVEAVDSEALSMAEAQQLVAARGRSPFGSILDASNLLGGPQRLPQGQVTAGVGSEYFEIRARLRMDKLVVEERSVVRRVGRGSVQVLRRERGTFQTTAASPASATR